MGVVGVGNAVEQINQNADITSFIMYYHVEAEICKK